MRTNVLGIIELQQGCVARKTPRCHVYVIIVSVTPPYPARSMAGKQLIRHVNQNPARLRVKSKDVRLVTSSVKILYTV